MEDKAFAFGVNFSLIKRVKEQLPLDIMQLLTFRLCRHDFFMVVLHSLLTILGAEQKPYKDPVDTYNDSYNNCQKILIFLC